MFGDTCTGKAQPFYFYIGQTFTRACHRLTHLVLSTCYVCAYSNENHLLFLFRALL